jgi:hypothetical protein
MEHSLISVSPHYIVRAIAIETGKQMIRFLSAQYVFTKPVADVKSIDTPAVQPDQINRKKDWLSKKLNSHVAENNSLKELIGPGFIGPHKIKRLFTKFLN